MAKEVLNRFTLPGQGDIIDRIADEQDEITRIKNNADFGALLAGWGLDVKKKGSGHVILCPFHDEKTPSCSVNLDKNQFHCFGCGKKGDIIEFVRSYRETNFKGALEILEGSGRSRIRKNPVKPPAAPSSPPEDEHTTAEYEKLSRETLDSITDYYHRCLQQSRKANNYLTARGLTDKELAVRFKLGYCNGTLAGKSSVKGIRMLKELGLLTEKGRETFQNYLVIPILDEEGHTVNLYGRSVEPGGLPHLYRKGGHKGVFNRKASKVYDEILLTESIIDALSLLQTGLQNVQAIYGTNGFTEEHLGILKGDLVKTVVLALDNDAAGRRAAEELAERIVTAGISIKRIFPDGKDWNEDLLVAGENPGALCEAIKKKIAEAEPVETTTDLTGFKVKVEGVKYLFTIPPVNYRLLGVKKNFVSNLRVNIRAEMGEEKYIDNVELYSARSRSSFSSHVAPLFDVPLQKVEDDLVLMLEYLEEERDRDLDTHESGPLHMTQEEKELGMELLTFPNLFERIVFDLSALGYVGEDLNKQLIYLAASSRKLDDPVSVLILSQSASGKSLLVETVRKVIPPEDVIAVSSLSDQALNYIPDGGLLHKFLILGEAVHSDVVEHQIREMLSNHELSRMVTIKNEKSGQMEAKTVKTDVIVSAMMSSTQHDINPENASRCFVINTDESREQTKRIHEAQQKKYTLDRIFRKSADLPRIIRQHHAAQRLLKKRTIINPFGEYLNFPDSLMRTRRDHERFVDLIASVCFLRQYRKELQREVNPANGQEVEFIECDLTDYEVAYRIIQGILPATISSFPKGALQLYDVFREMVRKLGKEQNIRPENVRLTQRQIRERTEYSQMYVKRYLKVLVEYEYIVSHGIKGRGSRNSYTIMSDEGINLLDLSIIPSPEKIKKMIDNKQVGQL